MAKIIHLCCAFAILVSIQHANTLQFGSRGLNNLNIRQSNNEHDAGKINKNENHNKNTRNENKILRRYTNKEFLFDDQRLSEAKSIDKFETVKTADLDPAVKISFEQENKPTEIDIDSKVLRQQRTNINEIPEGLENMMFTLLKFNQISNQKSKTPESRYNYLFEEPFDSEAGMKLNEIQGPKQKDDSTEKIDKSNFEDLYEQLIENTNGFGLHTKSDPFKEINVVRPSLHYKEAFISGNIYPHKHKGQAQNDDIYKQIKVHLSADSDPSHAKLNKYNINDPLNNQVELTKNRNDYLFVSVIIGCTIAALLAIIAGGVCFFTINRSKNSGFDGKHGIFGSVNTAGKNGSIKSTSSSSSGDRRLAQSAQMFHYQHQKQQMIAMEKANNDTKQDQSDNSEGEAEEGDYTVYECPGLAPTGEMEVKNPLFKEEFSNGNLMASSNSVSSMPPAYASVITPTESKPPNSTGVSLEKNLIEITESPKDSTQIILSENVKQ